MAPRPLQLVAPPPARPAPEESQLGDLGVTALIFVVGALPLACDLLGLGRWSGSTLGLGAAGALLSGREIVAWLVSGGIPGA